MLLEHPSDGKGRGHPCGHPFPEAFDAEVDCWIPRLGDDNERLTPIEDLKEVMIAPTSHQETKICTFITEEEENELID